MNTLTRLRLLEALPRPRPVTVPELGGTVFVRHLSGLERDALELYQYERTQAGKPPNYRGMLVALCTVDAEGHRLFTDEDAEAVGAIRADVLERLFKAAQRDSGFTNADVEALGKDCA